MYFFIFFSWKIEQNAKFVAGWINYTHLLIEIFLYLMRFVVFNENNSYIK